MQKDITERKHTADALQASEANLRKIIVEHPDGIVVVDREGAVRFVNPATGSLFGRKTEELMGETFGFPTVSGETSDVEVIHKTEGIIIAEMRVVEIDWEGQPALLASLHNITERKKAEEKLKEAMDIKSEFISTASHELRTPLTAMKEAVRLVAEEQTGKLNDEQKKYWEYSFDSKWIALEKAIFDSGILSDQLLDNWAQRIINTKACIFRKNLNTYG